MSGVLKELLVLLEERLAEHDENRKEVQNKLLEICSEITEDADLLENKISGETSKDFNPKEEQIFGLIEKLNEGDGDMDVLVKKAKEEMSKEWKYEIQHSDSGVSFVDSYKLKVSSAEVEKELKFNTTESIVNALQEHFEKIHESMTAAQEKLIEICNERRKQAEELEERINGKLEVVFKAEDGRIQSVVKVVKERIDSEDPEEVKELTRKAKLTLLKNQKYSISEGEGPIDSYDLKVEREASLKFIDFGERKPTDLIPSFTEKGELSLSFAFFNEDEVEVLKGIDLPFEVEANTREKGHDEEDTSKTLTKKLTLGSDEPVFFRSTFTASTTYCLKMMIIQQGTNTQWSDETEFTTPEFKDLCVWKECPDYVDGNRKYSLDENNPRIATKVGDYDYCTIIGSTSIPLNKVTSWSIKVLKSKKNDGNCVDIGVASSDINQSEDNNDTCGWYIDCYYSTLDSGPPHIYRDKKYGPRKEKGEYVHNGDVVGVVMDTTKGELSFVLDGVNLGVAYERIPLDKPLVPCVLLCCKDDSVELDTSEVIETVVDSSIPVPSNITTKSITWNSITLTWDTVEGASFYQIEEDENKFWGVSTTNAFTKRGLLPDTEHAFRVRAVRGNSVSEWSDVVKEMTQKESFETSAWKECPDDVYKGRKYFVDEKNPRIASKIGGFGYCTIIGNTPLSLNAVTSWDIKILESKDDNGGGICIGVAPFDIDQNEDFNYEKCGWYFDCCKSELVSGPPHNYRGKEYGPRKIIGENVHTGDSVGVVMDTAKDELSFALNGVNLGIAYEGITLDKPLVACVLLFCKDDSVELDTSEVKETVVDSSVPALSNITAKTLAWDSVALTWDAVEGTSFYQIEMDGSKFCDASSTNIFTKRGLLPDTEHTFRVRAVRGNSVGEWSDVVKWRTQKAPDFSECAWKKCPDNVDEGKKYSVDEKNPRIATKIIFGGFSYCTIIGNAPLPLSKVTSWSIKILKSRNNDGDYIYIGVVPFDVDQNRDERRRWYFECYLSLLFSGHPHNYNGKLYGPRRGKGEYVHTGDSVGVVMDTAKGELSFALNGVNLGIAYEGIPLDKPLVPCALLKNEDDSIELII